MSMSSGRLAGTPVCFLVQVAEVGPRIERISAEECEQRGGRTRFQFNRAVS